MRLKKRQNVAKTITKFEIYLTNKIKEMEAGPMDREEFKLYLGFKRDLKRQQRTREVTNASFH